MAVLGHRLVANHPLPDGNKRTALMCMIEFAEINGYVWMPPGADDPDGDETVATMVALAAGELEVDDFVAWVRERLGTVSDDPQPALFGEPDDDLPPDPLPDIRMGDRTARVYVASALTRLKDAPQEHARMVESGLHTVTQAVASLDLDGGLEFAVELYAPIEHSSAHRHTDLEPAEVFRRHSLQVLAHSDAAIIYGWEPGAGVGQEFAWATTQVCLPPCDPARRPRCQPPDPGNSWRRDLPEVRASGRPGHDRPGLAAIPPGGAQFGTVPPCHVSCGGEAP